MRSRILVVLIALVLIVGGIATALANPPQPGAINNTWARTDKPVADGQVNRTWMWGPEANTDPITEAYVQAPNGQRTVQYFDKSRMEITNPSGDQSDPWYVTNGLLVVELISGQMQTGDSSFDSRSPAAINAAGDQNDPNGITYQTLGTLLDAAPFADRATITAIVDHNGTVGTNGDLASYGVTAGPLVELTNHRVASVFWDFMNSSGLVYEDGGFSEAQLFQNPYFATGFPITEAYWATISVAGVPQNVLIQVFERRVLTYTPGNDAGWQVEAGNVGQHYYQWRYGSNTPAPPATTSPTQPPSTNPNEQTGTVTHVVDGDTFDVDINGTVYRVRLIGIDTPEVYGGVQCYGPEASAATKDLIEGKQVRLVKDVSETDRYDRLLRYVYQGDTFVNLWLVRNGYAYASTYPPDVAHSQEFADAQGQAQAENLGLWAGCESEPEPTATATNPPTPTPTEPPRQGCDPAYPTVCIPSPPPDLDCSDITYRRFTVLPPDPHRFDNDGDGIGCESD